jgi:oxygen-independent coproporphyrinogen-3 oxidase
MSGIYIHVPFCTEKCDYCDFFSGNQLYLIEKYVDAVGQELRVRNNYLEGNLVKTIYFGGGTPSLLTKEQINSVLGNIYSNFQVDSDAEITFECNPEHINATYVSDLYELGINRISLGIQFLDDKVLDNFNRKHNKSLIFNALEIISNSDIHNLSVDIIYSVPGISDQILLQSLSELMVYDIKHISAYSLTISKNSRLYWKIQSGQFIEEGEEIFLNQYALIRDFLKFRDFYQYELSNYAKEGFVSRHNLSYWNQVSYLGVGVSAHSFNGLSRQWNHNGIKKYINDLNSGIGVVFEIEHLTEIQMYNEFIIKSLRTTEGLSSVYLEQHFNSELIEYFYQKLEQLKKEGHFVILAGYIVPNENDLLIGDYLAKVLMF